MGIDGIGNKGSPVAPQPPLAEGVRGGRVDATQRAFEVDATRPTQAAGPEAVDRPRTALERLRAGEVDLDGYLDIKVHEATGHLAPLPASQLHAIRTSLRERLAGDPTMVDLVHTAAGQTVEPTRDE